MSEQYFYGHGKLLLTSEYFVLDGAKSLAFPTKLGQRMHVKYRPSNNPKLYWKSVDNQNKCWFETAFELWHFNFLDQKAAVTPEMTILQTVLREARKLNIHFLRDDADVYIETVLEFPLNWGLGSSSTLVYNIAQWAYVSPYELQAKTFASSGYDVACAQSMGPITYQIKSRGPHWETVDFNPVFKNNIYFVYLNKKQNSRDSIKRYREIVSGPKDQIIKKLNAITDGILTAIDLEEFEQYLFEHETIISNALDLARVRDLYFSDYWGAVKSLGAWGGDFALVTSNKSEEETKKYFISKGYETLISFDELILQRMNSIGGHMLDSGSDLLGVDGTYVKSQ